MAAKEQVQDDEPEGDEDEKGGKDAKKKKKPKGESGPMKLVIVGAIALFVAVLGAQVAAPILTKMIAGDPNAPKKAESAEGEGEQQLAAAETPPPPVDEKVDARPTEPALYVPLDPPFVVSFGDEGGDTRFVQLTLQAMARSEKTIDAIKTHSPAIRNAFLFVISGHKVVDLETLKGKEQLRAEMLKAANEIMEKNTGKADAIEELYFTSLVIQ